MFRHVTIILNPNELAFRVDIFKMHPSNLAENHPSYQPILFYAFFSLCSITLKQ